MVLGCVVVSFRNEMEPGGDPLFSGKNDMKREDKVLGISVSEDKIVSRASQLA